MARTGLTNLVAWAVTTLAVGLFLIPRDSLVVVAGLSLAFAMLAPFWPEALGVAAGVAVIFFVDALWPATAPTDLLATAVIAVAATVIWRWRQSRPRPAAPGPSVSPRLRLILGVLPAATALLLLDFVLALGFGFKCQSDTTHATPGSDRAAWCDTLGSGGAWIPLVFAPAALVLLGGIYFSSRGRPRGVLITVIAGFVLAIAVHIPDFVLSNTAP